MAVVVRWLKDSLRLARLLTSAGSSPFLIGFPDSPKQLLFLLTFSVQSGLSSYGFSHGISDALEAVLRMVNACSVTSFAYGCTSVTASGVPMGI